jgi:RimJ/RimL family protein N-acetyltransferase
MVPPSARDAGVILRVHRDPRACAHNPDDMIASPAEAVDRCRLWREHWVRHGFGYWVLRPLVRPAEVVGFCGLKVMTLHGEPVLNLFYRLVPSAWGAGLATEAASAVVEWAAGHAAGRPVIARVRPANVASARVATRVGLRRAAHLDTVEDHIYACPWRQ